jgi:hypothetical protein
MLLVDVDDPAPMADRGRVVEEPVVLVDEPDDRK